MISDGDISSGRINLSESGRIRKAHRANLAEDLRSPIRAILLYVKRLKESAEKAGKKELLQDLDKIASASRAFRSGLEELFLQAAREDVTIDVTLRGLDSKARHDLRTPLNHIIGYGEMLLEDAEDGGNADLSGGLEKICGWGRRILKLFSRLTADVEEGLVDEETSGENTEQVIEHLMQTVRPLSEDDPTRKDRSNGRILVADDNDINRDLLCQQVERQGHQVAQASNGREALEMLAGGQFDVLLLDVIMPELNGVEVLQRVRDDESLRHIPVIMLSALDELSSVARCIEIGAEDFIQKPYEWTLLRARIEAAIEKKRLRDREVRYIDQINDERKLSDRLLRAILPDQIIAELKATETVRPRRHDRVAVLFSDIVGFTGYCDQHQPEEVVGQLQDLME
ncbi:MAG: response regulator, partial [Planctomycetota bacterium]